MPVGEILTNTAVPSIDILACKIKYTDRSNMEMPRIPSFGSDHAMLDGSKQATPRLQAREFDQGTPAMEAGLKEDI